MEKCSRLLRKSSSSCCDILTELALAKEHRNVKFLIRFGSKWSSFNVHNLVLVSHSPLLKEILLEADADRTSLVIIDGFHPAIIQLMILFLYTGKVECDHNQRGELEKLAKVLGLWTFNEATVELCLSKIPEDDSSAVAKNGGGEADLMALDDDASDDDLDDLDDDDDDDDADDSTFKDSDGKEEEEDDVSSVTDDSGDREGEGDPEYLGGNLVDENELADLTKLAPDIDISNLKREHSHNENEDDDDDEEEDYESAAPKKKGSKKKRQNVPYDWPEPPKRQFVKRAQKPKEEVLKYKCNIPSCRNSYHGFREEWFLELHMEFHRNGDRHICKLCQKEFNKQNNLIVHHRIRHNSDGKTFSCEICGIVCNCLANLKKHQKTIHAEVRQTFACEHCGKIMKSMDGLKGHLKLHTGELVKCDYCEKRFTSATLMKLHRNRHTGDRPYVCAVCGKAFTDHRCLNQHRIRMHSEPKFPCEQCSTKFHFRAELAMHVKSAHLKIRSYVCRECGKGFLSSSNLRAHGRVHKKD